MAKQKKPVDTKKYYDPGNKVVNDPDRAQKFKESFDKIITEIEEYGYYVHWKVLNAKDFGVPQNRERVFGLGIRKVGDIITGN